MAPITERVTERRYRELAALNSSAFFSGFSRPPRITYGRKDSKPLSLTANQFRADTYAIPSDDEGDRTASNALLQASEINAESSEDSELPDAESVKIIKPKDNSNASGTQSAPGAAQLVGPVVRGPAPQRRAPARPVRSRDYSPARRQKTLQKNNTKVASKKTSRGRLTTPARRLPVNELFLVSASLDQTPPNTFQQPPASSAPGGETLDPINDQSSSPRKRGVSPISSDDEESPQRVPKAPLSAIRKRLKTPRWRHKSLKPRNAHESYLKVDSPGSKGCDGFEGAELAIAPRMKARTRPKRRAALLLGFEALQLRSGPLPDVEFLAHTTELEVKPSHGDEAASPSRDHDNATTSVEGVVHPAQSSRRRVSFSDRVREGVIRSQLSSISAPERSLSDSEESDIEPDEEIDLEEEEVTVEHEDGSIEDDDTAPAEQEPQAQDQLNQGVSLDFRRAPGRGPTTSSLRRRDLIEVNEDIVEVPEPDHQRPHYMIQSRQQQEPFTSNPLREHRPRSILKNSTQVVPDSTTRPEATTANTRRNSIVDVAESRYFTTAADALRSPDPARHMIVPRRRSSYFNQPDVEVPDSARVVPETSPEPPDYTNTRNLNVLHRTSEAVWSSSSLPTAAKDLKTLTRSVSREHGTLSQSVRRRPSLPFQSPAVVG